MSRPVFLGRKIRPLRVRLGLSQAALAQRLGISASYLNLVEHDRRPVTSTLLLDLARVLDVDLRTLAAGSDAELLSTVTEILSEPIFEDHPLTAREVSDFVDSHPEVARALIRLHQAYGTSRSSLDALSERLLDYQHDAGTIDRTRLSSEQVSDFIQRNENYFSSLENEARRVLDSEQFAAEGDHDDLFLRLARYLKRTHDVSVRVLTVGQMEGAVRRFTRERRELHLSETLRRGSRNFQLAAQIGLLDCSSTLDELTLDPKLTGTESRALCRVALANYFAAAVIMPYDDFLRAAESVRYDVELLGHRFRVGWEHACHRLTTLRRPGAEGIPFYFLRIDMAGNISKRFSAAGIQFPRFSGLCSLWNVHSAFLQPGRVRAQISKLPDGHRVLAIARTVQRNRNAYSSPDAPYAVGIGCDTAHARRLVYADGLDLDNAAAVPIGITCRLCERVDCTARAFPSIGGVLRVNEDVRGLSFYAPLA